MKSYNIGDVYYNAKTKTQHKIINGKIQKEIYTKEMQDADILKIEQAENVEYFRNYTGIKESDLSIFQKFKEFLFGRQIQLITVGNDEFPATPRQIANVKKLILERGINERDFILWNHTLKITKTRI